MHALLHSNQSALAVAPASTGIVFDMDKGDTPDVSRPTAPASAANGTPFKAIQNGSFEGFNVST